MSRFKATKMIKLIVKTCLRGFRPGSTQTGPRTTKEDGYMFEISELGRRGFVLSM